MKKLYNWLVNIPKDKLLHFIATYVVTMISCIVVYNHTRNVWCTIGASWFVAFIVGISKELVDECKYKGADELDWYADVVGYISSMLTFLVANIICP